jgi:hypothetical protein
MINVVIGIIHRPMFLCWLLVRSTVEQDGSSRAELLSCPEDYKNEYYLFCVIPIKEIEKIYEMSKINKTGAINKSLLPALDISFRAIKAYSEFKIDIM